MKAILFTLLIIITLSSSAQKTGYFEINLDLSAPQSKDYFYNQSDNSINNIQINEQGWLLNNYGINLSYNLLILKRLSIGTLSGFYSDTKQNFSHIRLGGLVRYFYVNNHEHNINIKLGENFSLDKAKFNSGVNSKIALGFSLFKVKNQKPIMLDIFWEQNYYELEGANKLLNLSDETPRTLTVHSYGLSLGILF